MASSDEHQSKIIVDGHHCERLWVNSEDDFLTGPQRVEMPAGLSPRRPSHLTTTLKPLSRASVLGFETYTPPTMPWKAWRRRCTTSLPLSAPTKFSTSSTRTPRATTRMLPAVNDDASSAAVDDHASDAGDADEEGSENGDKPANAAAASEYASAASQYAADMAEIDAAELAWTRLMATLRKLDNLKGRTDGMIRDEMYVVLHELEAMQGTFL
ncbi:hypothetical protein R3P38DRAFT_3240593 [Favolaschia claudopus]|uniref:Uncharacterized protein n=1 Tax=Favolaschia claudopus TaxID=2862362 RepID=A0AAV9Z718_9AGAR